MFPRAARKASSNTLQHFTKQSPMTNPSMLSTFNHIHTKKNNIVNNKNSAKSPQLKSTTATGNRWFSGIASLHLPALPQIASSLSPKDMIPKSVTESIGMFTGNTTMANKGSKIMQKVWEKRQKKLAKATNEILEKFAAGNGIDFKSVDIYIRKAGSFNDNEDNAQKEVHIALRGIAHTVVVLKTGNNDTTYLLDRVVEGIRLTELKYNQETKEMEASNKFKPEEMIKLSSYQNINLSSLKIAEWIDNESKTKYHFLRNSCVHFSFYFHQHFLAGLKMQQFYHSLKEKMITPEKQ